MNIIPLGGAGTVTGSRFLVTSGSAAVLVDCGLFQGLKHLRLRNWRPFPIPPERLDAVVLTHAHLDHSGYLPVLVREGYSGPILVTPPTADLLPILLEDAGRLQEDDARYAARKRFSRHEDPRPLFTEREAKEVLPLVTTVPFHETRVLEGFSMRFHRAGHILGAAQVHLQDPDGASVLFSGDLGRPRDLLLPPPEPRVPSDRVLMESTYGDREQERVDPLDVLSDVVRRTARRGGIVMVPAFAVGRAQTLALALHRLRESARIPHIPLFLNSPMAIRVGEVHRRHALELLPDREEMEKVLEEVIPVSSVEESRELNRRRGPMVIVAGAGMLTGGRILHHLRAFGGDPANTLLLAGYQAEGTRGRDLQRGAKSIKMHGGMVEIRCQVETLELFSAHADRSELLAWLQTAEAPPEGVTLVHGEPAAAESLRREIAQCPGWTAQVAEEGRPVEMAPLEALPVVQSARGG